MIARFIEEFDKHCILYLAAMGAFLDVFIAPPHNIAASLLSTMFTVAFLGTLVWYAIKAVCITSSTVANWERDHPGEPRLKSGGLTEYDEEKCRQTGQAVAEAIKKMRKEN